MTDAVFPQIVPGSHRRHALHSTDRDWPETNCYLDVWIEVLSVLGLPPESCLAYSVTQDFEGDQFTFFKVPLEDLEELFGISVTELAIYDRVENHVLTQLRRNRLSLVEVDSYFLPDTHGVGYHQAHGKTTIAINRLDIQNRSMDYFHGLGLFNLSGDDFDGIFQRGAHEQATSYLPYAEFVKFPCRSPGLDHIVSTSERLLAKHLSRRPATNPIAEFAAVFPQSLEELSDRNFDFFHLYAFNTLRQFGANFELFAAMLAWLSSNGRPDYARLIEHAKTISSTSKIAQFKLARAVMRKRGSDLVEVLVPAIKSWDRLIGGLDDILGKEQEEHAWGAAFDQRLSGSNAANDHVPGKDWDSAFAADRTTARRQGGSETEPVAQRIARSPETEPEIRDRKMASHQRGIGA